MIEKQNYTFSFYHTSICLFLHVDTTTSYKKFNTDSALSVSNTASIAVETNGKDSNVDSSTVQCQPTGIYSVADPTDCSAYYQCEKGSRTRMNCPERQLFDLDKRECNEYERVFCGTRIIHPSDKNQCKFNTRSFIDYPLMKSME